MADLGFFKKSFNKSKFNHKEMRGGNDNFRAISISAFQLTLPINNLIGKSQINNSSIQVISQLVIEIIAPVNVFVNLNLCQLYALLN